MIWSVGGAIDLVRCTNQGFIPQRLKVGKSQTAGPEGPASLKSSQTICDFHGLVLNADKMETLFNELSVLTKSFQLHRPLELLARKERNEIDGSGGAIITLRMIREYASYERRPFVMISRCNGVRSNNSCRELLVLLSVQKYT